MLQASTLEMELEAARERNKIISKEAKNKERHLLMVASSSQGLLHDAR
jgi:hypothetical protein